MAVKLDQSRCCPALKIPSMLWLDSLKGMLFIFENIPELHKLSFLQVKACPKNSMSLKSLMM